MCEIHIGGKINMNKKIFGLAIMMTCVMSSAFAANAADPDSARAKVVYSQPDEDGKIRELQKYAAPKEITLKDITRILAYVMPDMKKRAGISEGQKDTHQVYNKETNTWESKEVHGKLKHDNGDLINAPDQTHIEKEPVTIVNARRINGLEWVVRLGFGTPDANGKGATYEDYYIRTKGYHADNTNPNDPKYYIVNDDGSEELVYSFDKTLKYFGKDLGPKTKGSAYYFGLFGETGDHAICGFGIATRCKRWSPWNDLTYSYQSELIPFPDDGKGNAVANSKWFVRGEFIGCADCNKNVVGSYAEPNSSDFLAKNNLYYDEKTESYHGKDE